MPCSRQRAQAIHTIDEAWTQLIDRLEGDWSATTEQLKVLHRWKEDDGPPKNIGPVTMRRLSFLAWLALSEAALRATDERNFGDDQGERVPCV